jgi:hypothetical protein
VEIVEFRIQLDRLELFLPVRRCCLQRHVVGRFDRGLYIERRLDGRSLLLDGVDDGTCSRSCTPAGTPGPLR